MAKRLFPTYLPTYLPLALLATAAFAGDKPVGPATFQRSMEPLASIEQVVMPPVDRDALLAEDEERPALDLPPRFAQPIAVDLTPENSGSWEEGAPGELVWRLRVRSEGALSLNLGFGRYVMPAGGRLYVFAPDGSRIIGPYTAAENADHGQLWTPIVFGDEVVVELDVPAARRRAVELRLTTVGHDYKGFGRRTMADLEKSGTCNVDTPCPVGEAWRREIRSVAGVTTGGSLFCTGFMVNNTAKDFKPYFMTANHCGISAGAAPSLVVYWNYENSVCRGEPGGGGTGDGVLNQFQSGSTFRSASSASDFTLVELSQRPQPAFKVFYAGWDHSGANATSSACVHHPSGHTKRISFGGPTTITSYNNPAIPGNSTHFHVGWTLGVTEGGSSGSPLFNQDRQVIGQLHGGPSSCTAADKSDYYGRFSVSWTGGGTSATRLSDWLDPVSVGGGTYDGAQPSVTPSNFDASGGSDVVVYRNGAWIRFTAP